MTLPTRNDQPLFDTTWTDTFPWTQDALYSLARIFEQRALAPLNSLARWVLRHLALRVLNSQAKKQHIACRFVLRHSITRPGQFLLFQSDIDIAALFPRIPTAGDLLRLRCSYQNARRYLPLLGEMEVYTQAEWQTRERVLAQPHLACLIETLWHFRKLHWVETSITPWLHPYHRHKKQRALQASFRKLGQTKIPTSPRRQYLGTEFQEHLATLFDSLGFPKPPPVATLTAVRFYCDHLQCHFNDSKGLALPSELAFKLLSILPPAQQLTPELQQQVAAYRQHPAVGNTHSLLLLHEWMGVKSRQRTHPQTAAGNETWLGALRQELLRGPRLKWDCAGSDDRGQQPNSDQK